MHSENERGEDGAGRYAAGDGWHGKEWAGAEKESAQCSRGGCGHGNGHERARTPFEEQQLDGQQDGGERRGEDPGHARGGSCNEQRGPFGIAQMEHLRKERTHRASRHDDGAFRAERSAGTDGDGSGKRLEQSDARLNLCAVDQNGLDGLGNAVTADLVRSEARHQADQQAADDRHKYGKPAQMIVSPARQISSSGAENKTDWWRSRSGAAADRQVPLRPDPE